MLSPGKFHEMLPRESKEIPWEAILRRNLGWRWALLAKLRSHPEYRAGIIDMCRQDILFWIHTFVWQYNSDHKRRVAPFVPWKRQEDCILKILEKIEARKDLIIEKSRYQGASWIVDIVFDWMQRFHPWSKTHMISRVADLVDSVKDESLFWKLDFVDSMLPDWLKMDAERQSMFRRNKRNEAIISGEATTGKAGVGARATIMLIDEFAQIGQDFAVLHRTTETTHCRIFVSTHVGQDTAFFQICQSGAIEKFVLHWTHHPEQSRGMYEYAEGKINYLDKTYQHPEGYRFIMDSKPTGGFAPGIRSPYYDEQCERKGSSHAVAMDLDIDPEGSVSQFFDPISINALRRKYCCKPYLEGDLIYDEKGHPSGFEEHPGGLVRLWCHLDVNGSPPAGIYGAGADISTGMGATPSCFSLGDSATGDKLVEVATSRLKPTDFAHLCVALCRWFGNALFAWEQQGPGLEFGKAVIDAGYRHIYYKSDDLAYGNRLNQFNKSEEKPGWYPAPNAKRLLLGLYSKALTELQFLNRSDPALKETLSFKFGDKGHPEHANEKSEDPSAGTVNHGDRVVADALANMMMTRLEKPMKAEVKKDEGPSVLSLAWRRSFHENKEREEANELSQPEGRYERLG